MADSSQTLLQTAASSAGGDVRKAQHVGLPEVGVPQLPIDELGNANASDFEMTLPPNELYIDSGLAENIAILHVYECGDNQYSLWGNGPRGKFLDPNSRTNPKNLSLGKMVTGKKGDPTYREWPRDLLGKIVAFSEQNLMLLKWLRELVSERPFLIIADHTKFEIPWEMLGVEWGEYVGVMLATSRWGHMLGRTGPLSLTLQPDTCRGRIEGHIDRKTFNRSDHDKLVFGGLNPQIFDDIVQFRARLMEAVSDVGLVYIGAHGTFDENRLGKIRIGPEKTDPKITRTSSIRLLESYSERWQLIKDSGCIVFLNACHSGRLAITPDEVGDRSQRGLSQLFLRAGARGVISTLGPVEDHHGFRMAQALITKASQEVQGEPIGELLRVMRSQAMQNILVDEPNDDDIFHFIYTFMYVYYGNPRITLTLTQGGL